MDLGFNSRKKVLFFLQFLLLGIGLGIVEDLIAVYFAGGVAITWQVILIVTLVAIPFAALGELVVDRVDLPYLGKKTELIVEFFVFGLFVGIIEDLIAIYVSTGEPITPKIALIAAAVSLPFAIFSELIVDRLDLGK